MGTAKKNQTFQMYWDTTFNTLKQIIHFSFPSKGMNSIHFPENKTRNIYLSQKKERNALDTVINNLFFQQMVSLGERNCYQGIINIIYEK